jgi:hypothetical protein
MAAVLLLAPTAFAQEASKPNAVAITYDTGTVFKSSADDGKSLTLRLTWRNQVRWTEDKSTASGTEWLGNFAIVRSRIVAEGNAFSRDLTYKLEFSFSDKGLALLKDTFIDRAWGGGAVHVKVGQFKRPFDREQIVSDFKGEFNAQSIADAYVGGGRDVGGGLHNGYESSPEPVEWFVGVFNRVSGAGEMPTSTTTCTQDPTTMKITCVNGTPTNVPVDFQPALVARFGVNHGGIKGYSLADLEGGPLRIAIAANYKIGFGNLKDPIASNLTNVAGVDALVKVYGLDVLLGFFAQKQPLSGATTGDTKWHFAFNAQGGYFLTPKRLQVAARFALAPATDINTNNQLEVRVAINYFFLGHDWKWMTDFGYLTERGTNAAGVAYKPTLELRTMAQLVF